MIPVDAAWNAVLAAPDDDRALHVLADALMERGDPHGELIRLQLAGDEAGTSAHLEKHAPELLGGAPSPWAARWARGFLASIRVDRADEFSTLMSRPVARLLREVRLGPTPLLNWPPDPIQRLVEVLATRGPLTVRALRAESIGDGRSELEIAPLTARFSSLKDLSVATEATSFEGAQSHSLERLRLNLTQAVRGLGETRFTALTDLDLDLPYRLLSLPVALRAGTAMPKLETLILRGAFWPEFLEELAVSRLLKGLKRLELSVQVDTAWYPALLQRIEAFAHLEFLGVMADRNRPEWVAALKTALPQLRVLNAPPRFFIS